MKWNWDRRNNGVVWVRDGHVCFSRMAQTSHIFGTLVPNHYYNKWREYCIDDRILTMDGGK